MAINKPDNFMQLLECELERLHGRDHPLWDFWIEDHRNAVETMFNLFSLFVSGIGFITAPNRLWYREGHSGLFFANLLPHDLCERYVKWRGRRDRDDEWDVWHPTYWSLTKSLKRIGFEILANTIDYVTVYRFVKYEKIRPLLTPARYVAPLIFIVRKRI